MIFSELYSVYYNTVAKIMEVAFNPEAAEKDLQRCVMEEAFSESVLTILPALKSGKWPLLHEDLSPVLLHKPTMPLTNLEKRWLKAIAEDPRVKLFDVAFPELNDVEPLFTRDDYKIYDQYSDGDPFEDEAYIKHFRLMLSAIRSDRPVQMTMLITPEKLEFGKGYSLKEVSAPYGYVLSHEAVKFDVTEENSTEESGVTIVAVNLGNYAQKGIIKISKTGEVFASVTAADGVYQPVYTVQGLAGATYEIKAAEDIYTPDGTLRCSAGEVVDTVTTGADGTAESKPLYLGKYEITEMKAPDGMVINKDAHTAELVYAGQEIEITETAASFCNDRQKARISLSKVLEQNKQFGIGMNNELSAVTFGFYAAEELTAADGSVIPVDGLIEIMSLVGVGILAQSNILVPDIHGILHGVISDFSCLFHSVSFCKWGGIFLRMPPLGVFTFCSSGEERSALR